MKAMNLVADAVAGVTGYRAWSPARHALTAFALLAGLALLVWGMLSQQSGHLLRQQTEMAQMEQSLIALSAQAVPMVRNEPDFTQRWPQRDEINAVVRFLGSLAQQQQVSLGQMTLSHTASSAQAVGRVDMALTMNGAYASGKLLLSELMSRYPSLALQSLTATPRSGDASRIDWALALTLYVKD